MCAPTGPSLIRKAGIPSRAIGAEAIMLEPESMVTFSSRVILAMVSLIFFSSSGDWEKPAAEMSNTKTIAQMADGLILRRFGRALATLEFRFTNSLLKRYSGWGLNTTANEIMNGDSIELGFPETSASRSLRLRVRRLGKAVLWRRGHSIMLWSSYR